MINKNENYKMKLRNKIRVKISSLFFSFFHFICTVSVIALPICDKGIDENVDSGSIKLTEVTILPENYGIQGYLNVFTYTQPINKIGGEFLPFCQTKTSFPRETFHVLVLVPLAHFCRN